MKRLPLYPVDKRVPLETAVATKTDSSCTLCTRHQYARNRCIPGSGDAVQGCVLVIGSAPSYTNDVSSLSFVDDVGGWVRHEIARVHKGPVFYSYAARCYGEGTPTNDEVSACQTYLASMVRALKPSKIITLGDAASYAVVGRRTVTPNKDGLHVPSANRPYAYLHETKTPVYMLRDAAALATNRFAAQEFQHELSWVFQEQLPAEPPWEAHFYEVETPEDAQQACDYLRMTGAVVFDTEFSGHLHTEFFQVDTLAMVRRGETTAFVWGDALGNEGCVAPLRAVLEDPTITKGGHNLSIDIRAPAACPRLRADVQNGTEDSMLARKLMRSDASVGLEQQAESVGMGGHKAEMQAALARAKEAVKSARANTPPNLAVLRGALPRPLAAAVAYPEIQEGAFTYGLVDAPLRNRYCALDTVATSLLIVDVLGKQFPSDEGARRTYDTFMCKVPRLVARMESKGMMVSRSQVRTVAEFAERNVAEFAERLATHANIEWTSPAQVSDVFFNKLGLTNKGSTSVDADALKALKGKHPVVDLYAEYKGHQTVRDRYGIQLLRFCTPDGRIHGRFNPIGTETARWSSNDPNLQNMPARNPVYGPMISNVFVAPPGYLLLKADYSQIEYRVAAYLSGDEVMQQIFKDGIDLHRRTAELISELAWNIPQDVMKAYDKDQIKKYRSESKTVNFGTLYCLSDSSLAEDLKCSVAKASLLKKSIMGLFVQLDAWVNHQQQLVLHQGFTNNTLFGEIGRRRYLSNSGSRDEYRVASAQRQAVNSPAQGSAAEIMTDAMCELDDVLADYDLDARIISQVHDAIYVEVRERDMEQAAKLMKAVMESRGLGEVPLVAEFEVGPTLGAMKELKVAS
jgi:uracil-DNA glycosylase family 4